MPLVPHVAAGQIVASTWGNLVADHVVMRFTTAAQRASQLPAPPTGQLTMLDSAPGIFYRWDGSAWVNIAGPSEGLLNFNPALTLGPSSAGSFESPPFSIAAGYWTLDLMLQYTGSASVASPLQQVSAQITTSSTGQAPGGNPNATQLTQVPGVSTFLPVTNLRVMATWAAQAAHAAVKFKVSVAVGGGNSGIVFNLCYGLVRIYPT